MADEAKHPRSCDVIEELTAQTGFQEIRAYDPRIDIKSDVVVVYGVDPKLPEKIATWRREGYRIHVMIGVSWGNYTDRFRVYCISGC